MTRKIVDLATIELLKSLEEPVELCDETGHVLGTFNPESAELVAATALTVQRTIGKGMKTSAASSTFLATSTTSIDPRLGAGCGPGP